jgi:adenosylhomocysteinase
MGAHVIVTEVEPVRALEAVMDGYRVMPMKDAAKEGDLFVTVTGDINVVDEPHLKAMKSGAILANSGHFNDEINLSALDSMAESVRTIRPSLEEYRLRDGRKLFVLGEGRLVNLAAAEGHPAAVMDMSFANQALSAEYLVSHARELQPRVYPVPDDIDREIARLKLAAMHIDIDSLTAEQAQYLGGWESGTR